MNVDFNVDL